MDTSGASSDLSSTVFRALSDEMRTAVGLAKHGFAGLQAIDSANDLYHLPLLLLASSIERLGKCALWLHSYQMHGEGLTYGDMRDLGHDLEEIVDTLVERCFTEEHFDRPITREDYSFLRMDELFRMLLRTLSVFASADGRYYNINLATGKERIPQSPEDQWQKIENLIGIRDPEIARLRERYDATDEFYRLVNARLVETVERAICAIARLFVFGRLGQVGHRVSGDLYDFAALRDEEFGATDYRGEMWAAREV